MSRQQRHRCAGGSTRPRCRNLLLRLLHLLLHLLCKVLG